MQTKPTATQETHAGVEGVSQQILAQWQEAARKKNKPDPQYYVQVSLLEFSWIIGNLR